MSVCADADYDNLENNENLQPVSVNWHIKDEKNCSGSQEIFSDNDHAGDISRNSPRVSAKNDTFNSSVISIKTPTLCAKINEETPGRAVVPRTPADLLPFIKKTSFLWNSDMETPESKINDQSRNCDKTFNSIDNANKTPTRPKTPPQESMELNPKDVTSPVLGGRKRSKRKVKRRLLNNVKLDLDNNNDRQSNGSSDKISSEATSPASSEVAFDIHKEVDNCAMKESNNLNNVDCRENKLLEEAINPDKNSNTSTQDFFSNASFSSIDKLCSTAIKEEKIEPESNSNQQEITNEASVESKENKNLKIVSNHVLERVAAIRKNQKPIRRSTDISHTVIPKEVFAKPVMDLELADAKSSQERKPTVNNAKSLGLIPFSKLSMLDNEIESESQSTGKNVKNSVINNVPVDNLNINQPRKNQISVNNIQASSSKFTARKESFDKVHGDKGSNESNQFSNRKETRIFNEQPVLNHGKHILLHSDNQSDQSTDGFSTAKGKNIPISENRLLSYAKVYQEIEKEIPDENTFLGLKQKKEQPTRLPPILGRQTSTENKKTEKLKLCQDLELKEFLEPKCSPEDMEIMGDGFSTAQGGEIPISRGKESLNLKICSELNGDLDVHAVKKPNAMKPVVNQTLKNSLSNRKAATSSTVTSSDGFSTARGGNILISEEKESHYMKIYDELSDDTDSSAVKKPSTVNPVINQPIKSSAFKRPEISNSGTARDGFGTARGVNIPISEEKESHYMKIYDELSDDTDFSSGKKPSFVKPVINQPIKSSAFKRPEISNSGIASDGFATARGGGISISDEKEKEYLKFYNESDDIDEDSLLNIKTNKQSKLGSTRKPTDKVVLTFNKKPSIKLSVRAVQPSIKPSVRAVQPSIKLSVSAEVSTAKSSNDGFSTAKGMGIPINSDKESHYFRVCNELSDEIPGDTSQKKVPDKPILPPKQIKVENIVVKKENKDVDEVLEDIGDLAEFFSPPHQTNFPENSASNFIVPNSTNILKKADLPVVVKKELLDDEEAVKTGPSTEDKPAKNAIGLLKRKLDDCDPKRTGRCRSFGGFPATDEAVSATKLNKSDPHNDSSLNRPLSTGHSVSQCFDPLSDSFLLKADLSGIIMDGSKVSSPKARQQKNECVVVASGSKSRYLSGFSAEESLGSFRLCSTYKNFLRKTRKKCKDEMVLHLRAGKTVTFKVTNQTSATRQLFLQHEQDVDMKKNSKELSYVLVDAEPKKFESNRVENIAAIEIGKRKHADTDSDTPLTSVKKPRVGSEFQGRKLFSDKPDDEECNETERVASGNTEPVISMETQDIEAEEEEVDLSEERLDAVMQQEKIIRNKKRMKIKPIVGLLLSERLANTNNRTTWSQLVGSSVPMPLSIEQIKQNHPDVKVLEVTASNASCYTFLSSTVTGKKNIVSLEAGDGALLIFDKNGQAGVSQFLQAFLAMPGVDPKLLPAGWVENHYKWIVWKLAALDRIRFGSAQLAKNLTPQRVMGELKYRYDREIDRAQRPALRRILEKDDLPSRRMVLCISSIKECAVAEESDKEVRLKLGLPRWKVEATDGWYDIPLTIDSAMADYISTGKIKEGTKIITYGAELMECERGFYPLEKPPNVCLKIYTNCTRRARWDAKMGYQKTSRPLPVKLRDIIAAGGMIGEITAAAARVYPVLYREKTADGKSIYRNARCEEKAAADYDRAVEKKMDAMYAEAQKNFDSKKKSEFDEDFYASQTQMSSKFNNFERKQEEFKRDLESQVRQGLPPRRDVTTVLKVRLVDDATTVILSIWGAGEESDCDIREGDTVSVYNCFAAGHRGGDLHLTASRITHIKTEPLLKLPYPNRLCTLIPDIKVAGFEPKFAEFDTVGVVVSSGSAPYGMKNFEVVNIAYPKPDDSGSSYLSILFWNGVSSFGYQGIFTPGTLVACSNLEWRRNLWSVAVGYCSDKSVFTINPRQAHLLKELRNLKALVQHPQSYAQSCVEDVAAELAKKPQRSSQGTPTSWPTNVSIASPADNYSPGNVPLQKRLDKLSRYGSSPEISPIVLNGTSSRIKKDFTPVTRR